MFPAPVKGNESSAVLKLRGDHLFIRYSVSHFGYSKELTWRRRAVYRQPTSLAFPSLDPPCPSATTRSSRLES
ncbi:hypothetical protein E2C01_086794 [Portunus trituberculatus]|uniref:Uncharacterized protein n=1 Tax=Portunus trituberculatus TaxID=210409 RepID=A0A5B7JFL3_PORTR|nr:hypothetical protein [Portunus trituberculatus]